MGYIEKNVVVVGWLSLCYLEEHWHIYKTRKNYARPVHVQGPKCAFHKT